MKMKFIILIPLLLLLCPPLPAEPLANSLINGIVSRDELQSKVERIKETTGGDEESKQKQIQWLQLADENIANKTWYEYLTTTYQDVIKTAPKLLKQKYLSKVDKKYRLKKGALEKDYELQLVNLKSELRSINEKIDTLENTLEKNKRRPAEIREEILHAEKAIEQAKAVINSENTKLPSKYENEARQLYIDSLIAAYVTELKKLDSEIISNPVQIQLNKKHIEDFFLHEDILDISKINQQTLNIVNLSILVSVAVSAWFVWQNIFPAFSFLDNIVLWQHTVITGTETALQAITLTDLCFSGLYLFIIVTAVVNFPGLMEVLLFQHSNIEPGSRYAINQLAKYAMITIGFIAIANKLGGSWSQVQWLVAALTVGLGFGLQEIFANMVSGIILLFERPIRVGDTVTVDNITGRVTRIQMRATTLLDWDKKELIVPNKTFITNQLVNWSLTSPMTRIVIPLGISYDADVKVAYQVIKEAVMSSPFILESPEPTVIFTGFGDSSLDFSIRVYVSELDDRLPAKHDLHMRLLDALRVAGIEIPFPQRDLHIRSENGQELFFK